MLLTAHDERASGIQTDLPSAGGGPGFLGTSIEVKATFISSVRGSGLCFARNASISLELSALPERGADHLAPR